MSQNKNGPLVRTQQAVEIKRDESNSTTPDGAHIRDIDPVRGWYSLAAGVKPSRERAQKKSWNRGAK
jgi:hypothetical protein